MEPIVHGLSQEYAGRVVFESRNADEAMGKRSADAYGLRGHPAYVIALPSGAPLWSRVGLVEEEVLRAAIEQFAATGAADVRTE